MKSYHAASRAAARHGAEFSEPVGNKKHRCVLNLGSAAAAGAGPAVTGIMIDLEHRA